MTHPPPPSVDGIAAELVKRAERISHAPPPMTKTPSRAPKIAVRRFAGPSIYTQQLAHVRIAHITDQHFGRVTPVDVQKRAIELTNAEEPDLVVLTGDFVCHSQAYLDQLEEVMRGLKAPAIGVLGNHDYWSGAEEVRASLKRAGVEILRNQNTVVTLHHERVQIVGLDDAYTGHARRDKAVKGMRRDLPTVGLSHIAEEADWMWAHGVPLVFSGHTHAGQVTLAKLHELAIGKLAGHRYVHGLYGKRDAAPPAGAVYVGAGIGAAVVPLRIGERGQREVAVFELGYEPGAFPEHHTEQRPLAGRKPSAAVVAKRIRMVQKKHQKRTAALLNGKKR